MGMKAFILEVISWLLDSVLFYLLLLLIACWLLKDKILERINRKSMTVQRKTNTEDDHDDDFPDIKDFESYDVISGSDDADTRNYPDERIPSSLVDFDNPDKVMMKWRNQIIKFAVTGRSGMGKSTFINLIRDVYPGDPYFAEVGFGDCTMNQTEYKHPRNEHITFTDLPGFGTDTVTKTKFSESIDLSKFDFVFIFIDSVIMEDDIWVVKELRARGTPYSFIRSKIDVDISNAKDMGKNETEVVNEIRRKLQTKISENRLLKGSHCFLISNKQKYFYIGDIGRLFSFITDNLSKEKGDSLLFFLPILSPEMIETKFQMLRGRIELISVRAAAVSAIPVPFLDTAINVVMVKNEIKYYIEIFQLDKEYVAEVPGVKKRNPSEIRLHALVTSGLASTASLGMTLLLSQADCMIPVLGSVIAANATSVYVRAYLSNALLEMKNDAIAVNEHYTKH